MRVRGELEKMIGERQTSVQLLLHFASSAFSSPRAASLARPLPPDVSLDEARALFAGLPKELVASIGSLAPSSLEFLRFLLCPDGVSIRKIGVQKHWNELNLPAKFRPDAIFEVEYGSAFHSEFANVLTRQKHAEFVKAQKQFPTKIAFHGTELCNLHNVLREGLKNDSHLAGRNGQLFGKGIYLSEDLDVAMNFLSYGKGRGGVGLACMLECEVVLDPQQALRGSEEQSGNGLPSKYIVVKNDCLVRPKRLFIYHQKEKANDYRWLGSLLAFLFAIFMLLLMFVKKSTLPMSRLIFWD